MKRLVAVFLAVSGTSLGAQRVRVELHGESEAVQLTGVLVSAVNEHDSTVAQGLSNTQGVRVLALPTGGTYRIVARRIGFLPVRSDPITLASGDLIPVAVSLTLPAEKVLLPAISVTAMRKECSGDDENALAAAAVWDQIRTALQSAEASRKDSLVRTRVTTFERQLSPGDVVMGASTKDLGVTGARPFSTPSPSFLSESGYVVVDSTHAATYYGPDANVLLSSEFEHGHCFGLVAGQREHAGLLGLAFHPVRDRGIPDIEGTLWLEKSSLTLKQLTFQYVDVKFPANVRRIGGEVEFQRVGSGAWFPSYWILRIPRFREAANNYYEVRPDLELAGYIEVGATAAESKQVDMRAFMAATLPALTPQASPDVSAASRRDSINRAVLPAASTAGNIPPGCKTSTPGAIAGIVRDESGAPVPFANISFEARSESGTIAERNGCFLLHGPENVPLTVLVRRIGYREHRQPTELHGDSSAFLDIRLSQIAMSIAGVTTVAERDRALEQTGFYDRLLDRKKGLGDGWFITPEDIERRNEDKVTHLVEGFPSIKLEAARPPMCIKCYGGGRIVLVPMGADGRCIMSVFVDGSRFFLNPKEAQGASVAQILKDPDTMGIDDYLTPGSVAAIEVYPRAAQVPPRYQQLNGNNCGVVLIWTKS